MADKLGMKVLFDYQQSYKELQEIINKLSKEKVNVPISFGSGSNGGNTGSGKPSVKPIKEMSDALIGLQNELNTVGKFDIAKTPIENGMKVIGYSTKEVGKNFENFTQSLNNGQNQIVTYSGTVNKLNNSVELTGKSIRQTTRENNTFSKEIGIAIKRTIEWSIAVGGWYKILRSFKDGIQFVYELSNSLNQIRIVTGQSVGDVSKLAKEYNNLAIAMGSTTKEIAKSSVEYYRQGLSQEETNKRMEATIKYSKISGLSMQESTDIITAAANGTKKSVNEIIDVYANLGDMTASGADEIGTAMSKVAASAETAGVPFEKMSAYIATVSSITRESAENVGNSFKSLMARYTQIREKGFNDEDAENINGVTKALKAMKIDAIDPLTGQLRPFADVMDEVGKKFKDYDGNTQKYVATALGGTYQMNRLLTLLNNYPDALNNIEIAYNSAGSAQQKFDIYMESSEAKVSIFRSTMEKLWLNTFNSESMGKIIEFGTNIISLVDSIGVLNLVVIAAGTAIIVYLDKINKTILAIKALNPEIAITVAVMSALVLAVGAYNQHQQKMYDNAVKNAKALSEESTKTKDLMQSISDLTKKQSLSNEERERLGVVQAELQKIYPDILSNLDLEKMSYEDLEIAVRNATQAKKEQALEDVRIQKEKLQSEIKNMKTAEDRWSLRGLDNVKYDKQIPEKQKQLAELNALTSDILMGGSLSDAIEKGRLGSNSKVKNSNIAGDKTGSASSSSSSLKDSISQEDLTKELIKSYNAEVDITDQKIKHLERQLKINDEQKDYNKELELTNQLISTQEGKLKQLESANKNISSEAQNLRDTNKNYDTTKWFDVNGEATLKYKELLNSFAKQSEDILSKTNKNSKDSVKIANEKIDKLNDEKKKVEELFNNIYALKHAWTANRDEIEKTNDTIGGLKQSVVKLNEEQQKKPYRHSKANGRDYQKTL